MRGIWASGIFSQASQRADTRINFLPCVQLAAGLETADEDVPSCSYHVTHSLQPLSLNHCLLSSCLSLFPSNGKNSCGDGVSLSVLML